MLIFSTFATSCRFFFKKENVCRIWYLERISHKPLLKAMSAICQNEINTCVIKQTCLHLLIFVLLKNGFVKMRPCGLVRKMWALGTDKYWLNFWLSWWSIKEWCFFWWTNIYQFQRMIVKKNKLRVKVPYKIKMTRISFFHGLVQKTNQRPWVIQKVPWRSYRASTSSLWIGLCNKSS